MIVLAIKTDQPEAELCLYGDGKQLGHIKWVAHRQLAETLNYKIDEILTLQDSNNFRRASKSKLSLNDVGGIICFKGPGSFTGLRIGLSTANALAYAQGIPILACGGDNWIANGLEKLISGKNDKIALPEYGGPVHTTKPKK